MTLAHLEKFVPSRANLRALRWHVDAVATRNPAFQFWDPTTCLAENGGRWALLVADAVVLACVGHGRLLCDVCPVCARFQRSRDPGRHFFPSLGGSHAQHPDAHDRDVAAAMAISARRPGENFLEHPALRCSRPLLMRSSSSRTAFGVYARTLGSVPAELIADLAAVSGHILAYSTPAG